MGKERIWEKEGRKMVGRVEKIEKKGVGGMGGRVDVKEKEGLMKI